MGLPRKLTGGKELFSPAGMEEVEVPSRFATLAFKSWVWQLFKDFFLKFHSSNWGRGNWCVKFVTRDGSHWQVLL